MEHRGTYSPDDNKLRLYPAYRLDSATYERVRAAGFIWAGKQELFVAPAWTPSREDLLTELCGEVEDEDTSLLDRAEERAERFEGYQERRADDAHRAREAVSAIADNIPLGQPILVGHHSEKRARRDAEKIETGMRRAVKLWETSKYWAERAAGALAHAKYKELPQVRARRIEKIEADLRKIERSKREAETCLKIWTTEGLTHEQAVFFAGHTRAGNLSLPRKEGDKPDFHQNPDAYSALTNSYPNLYAPRTVEEVVEVARRRYPATIAYCDRWIAHYQNRLVYEKAMLAEQGASALLEKKPRPKQLPLCNYRNPEGFMVSNPYRYSDKGDTLHYPQVEMTAAEYAKIYTDRKGTIIVDRSHRVRTAIMQSKRVAVFITDGKTHERPAPIDAPKPEPPKPRLEPLEYKAPERTAFDDLRDTLKAGVQVVSAPQLFPTPEPLARRMVELAGIEPGHRVLEPSAGTGNILRAIGNQPDKVAVEINPRLVEKLAVCGVSGLWIHQGDFLSMNGDLGTFDRVVMNPPFQNAEDIKHIRHALHMLKPGGVLVALCANGPRQREQLQPLASYWEDLPAGTFAEAGTGVNVALLTIEKGEGHAED